jgi:hypothetical protein
VAIPSATPAAGTDPAALGLGHKHGIVLGNWSV